MADQLAGRAAAHGRAVDRRVAVGVGNHLVVRSEGQWRLAAYQNPRYIAMVDDFERTASQRIMKHKLTSHFAIAWDRMAKR